MTTLSQLANLATIGRGGGTYMFEDSPYSTVIAGLPHVQA